MSRPTDWHPQLGADGEAVQKLVGEWGYGIARLSAPETALDHLPDTPAELILEPG